VLNPLVTVAFPARKSTLTLAAVSSSVPWLRASRGWIRVRIPLVYSRAVWRVSAGSPRKREAGEDQAGLQAKAVRARTSVPRTSPSMAEAGEPDEVESALLIGFKQRAQRAEIDRAADAKVIIAGPFIGLVDQVEASFGADDGQVGQGPDFVEQEKWESSHRPALRENRTDRHENVPASGRWVSISRYQSGQSLVHAGNRSVLRPEAGGGRVHENCESQDRLFSVSSAERRCTSKSDELLKLSSRVDRFKSASASRLPSPNRAEIRVARSSGASHWPAHEKFSASNPRD